METVVLDKIHKLGALVSPYGGIPAQKSVSTIIKVVTLTTDKKSIDNAKKLLLALEFIQKKLLPIKDESIEIKTVQKNLESINKNLFKLNGFLEVVYNIFAIQEDDKIVIDDSKMKKLLENLNKSKEKLEHISEYLTLLQEVQKSKQEIKDGNAKMYCFDKNEKFIELPPSTEAA